MLYKVPLTYIVYMFQVHKLHKFQLTSLKIHSGHGGINRPVFNLRV